MLLQRVGATVALLVTLLALLASTALAAPAHAADAVRGELVLAQSGSQVTGTIRLSGGTVEGVVITATADDGTDAGTATTGEDGKWVISLPGPGTYTIAIDLDSIPEGSALRDGLEPVQVIDVDAGAKSVVFALVPADGSGGTAQGGVERFLNLLVQGVKLGAIIAMTSVGLSLIFGVTALVNFAHGELVTFGAIVAYYLNVGGMNKAVAAILAILLALTGSRLADRQLFSRMRMEHPEQGQMLTFGGYAAIGIASLGLAVLMSRGGVALIIAAVLAALAGAVFGSGLELGLFKPLRRRGTGLVSMLVITIGLSFFIRHVFLLGTVFGSSPTRYNDYALQPDRLEFGPISVAPRDLAVIIASGFVLVAVGLFLQRTRLGKAMRAVADNKDLAESSGIDVQRVILAVWFMGGGLAALGGVLQALTTGAVEWDMGFVLLLLMFAGIIVGGLGTAFGAMVGGLVIGIASEVATLWISVEFKLVLAFLLLIVVLLFRPTGILGRAERFG